MEVVEVLHGRSLGNVDLQQETDLPSLLESVERAAIDRALRVCGGNQTLAAERLGISRRTLIYRMQSHGIPGPRHRD
jgi:DNA-binding NtrC family response regulator